MSAQLISTENGKTMKVGSIVKCGNKAAVIQQIFPPDSQNPLGCVTVQEENTTWPRVVYPCAINATFRSQP